MELPIRFELMTPSLPWKCSTTELSGRFCNRDRLALANSARQTPNLQI